jgi:hypothetical protein
MDIERVFEISCRGHLFWQCNVIKILPGELSNYGNKETVCNTGVAGDASINTAVKMHSSEDAQQFTQISWDIFGSYLL